MSICGARAPHSQACARWDAGGVPGAGTGGSQVRGALAVREGSGLSCARWTDVWAPCGAQRGPQRSGLGLLVVLESRVTAPAAVARWGWCGACGKDIWPDGHCCLPWHPWPWPRPVRGGPTTSAAPVPALCGLHSHGWTPRAAIPSSLAGLGLGGPPSKNHPPSGAVKFSLLSAVSGSSAVR